MTRRYSVSVSPPVMFEGRVLQCEYCLPESLSASVVASSKEVFWCGDRLRRMTGDYLVLEGSLVLGGQSQGEQDLAGNEPSTY